jgi:hypothetical protein
MKPYLNVLVIILALVGWTYAVWMAASYNTLAAVWEVDYCEPKTPQTSSSHSAILVAPL